LRGDDRAAAELEGGDQARGARRVDAGDLGELAGRGSRELREAAGRSDEPGGSLVRASNAQPRDATSRRKARS
jgi:hypothetical protein